MSDDDAPIEFFLIAYPPDEPDELDAIKDAVVIPEGDADFWTRLMAHKAWHTSAQALQGNRSTAGLVQSFVDWHEAGIYPTDDAMGWLAEGFTRWLESDGKTPMEVCLGLRKPSGHAADALKEWHRQNRLSNLVNEIHRLRLAFHLTIQQAVQMVWDIQPDFGRADLPQYTEGYLSDAYKRAKLNQNELATGIFRDMSDDIRKEALARYPRHTYQHLIESKPKIRRNVE